MEKEQRFYIAMAGTEWEEAAHEMLNCVWNLEDVAAYHAGLLVDRVLANTCSVQQLRAGVVWVNALDAESAKRGIYDQAVGEEKIEAVARRLANHAGRIALDTVKTSTKLDIARVNYRSGVKWALF